MMKGNGRNSPLIPGFLRGPNILVPIKLDITYRGARFVDTFCWNLYCPACLPEEFIARTCADMNLPAGFQQRMSQEMTDQLIAYQEIIDCVYRYGPSIPHWEQKISKLQPISIGIRHSTVDYSDKIDWDPLNTFFTPEEFAAVSCADLGLPAEIEPAIAHKIRESLFRWIVSILQNPDKKECQLQLEFKIPDNKVLHVPTTQVTDMISNLWKRAKPNSLEENASVPPRPANTGKDTNAHIWLPKSNSSQQPDSNQNSSLVAKK